MKVQINFSPNWIPIHVDFDKETPATESAFLLVISETPAIQAAHAAAFLLALFWCVIGAVCLGKIEEAIHPK
jgi:hypothetical protein